MKASVPQRIGISLLVAIVLFSLSNVLPLSTAFAASVSNSNATPVGTPGTVSPISAAPTQPSASCLQPNRHQDISTLTLKERLDQGYPLPVQGKTNPTIDKIVHDKGKHFCADTDVPRIARTSIKRASEANSRIWSGNYAIDENYTLVVAQWVESCIRWGTNDHVVTWVGIGGTYDNNLVQTGSEEDNWSATSHQSYVWVENTGSTYNVNLFNINCGDTIFAEVGSGNCMYVADVSSGSNSGWRCSGPNANSESAECIVEAPTINKSIAYLSNYGTEQFVGCQVEVNAGSAQGINTVPHNYFDMFNGKTLLSSTGPITNNNTYTMSWHSYS